MSLISYSYSLPYILTAFYCLSFNIIERKKKSVTNFFIVVVLIFFFGLRGFIFTDFISYYPFFLSLPTDFSKIIFFDRLYEPGFIFSTYLFKLLTSSYFVWVLLKTSFEIIAINYFFNRYSFSVALSWFCFFVYSGVTIEVNLYRNIVSIILFLFSIKYIIERKLLPFLTLNIIGVLFHSSAIIYLPCYFFLNKNFSTKFLIIVIFIVNVCFFLNIHPTNFLFNYLNDYFDWTKINIVSKYLNPDGNDYGLSIGYFERTLTVILCLLYYKKSSSINGFNRIFFNSYFLYYIIFYLVADIPLFTERFSFLFVYSYWIIIPYLLSILKKSRYRIIAIYAFILFSILKMGITYKYIYCKYENLLFGIETFDYRKNIYLNNPLIH